jgi:hypothetical protein
MAGLLLWAAGVVPAAADDPSEGGIRLVHDEAAKKVEVRCGDRLFTAYLYPDSLDKPVLFPLLTAGGTAVTRGFPLDPKPGDRVDHPHQAGLWFNFGDVNGLDFWNNSYAIPPERKHRYGVIRHRAVKEMRSGQQEGSLTVTADWTDHAGHVLLDAETRYVFAEQGNRRTVEHSITLTAIGDTVVFTDNKEGLFALRVDRAFEEPSDQPDIFIDANGLPASAPTVNSGGANGRYRSSEGLEGSDVWGKPARRVSLSARKNGEDITLTIADYPSNPGYPARWHARGYGLFAANNMGSRSFSPDAPLFTLRLLPGRSVTFKHLIIVDSGKADADVSKAKGEAPIAVSLSQSENKNLFD